MEVRYLVDFEFKIRKTKSENSGHGMQDRVLVRKWSKDLDMVFESLMLP